METVVFKEKNLDRKIVKLNGGLGNQMFQYAFAHVLLKTFNVDVVFDFSFFEEIKSCPEATTRVFELTPFNLECKEATDDDLSNVVFAPKPTLIEKFLWSGLKISHFKPRKNNYFEHSPYTFYKKALASQDYLCYEGYFQNEKYFKSFRKDLLKLFSLRQPVDEKNQSVLKLIESTNSVSLHVRRGDYVTLDCACNFHGLCSLEYYENAVKYMADKIKMPHFFLFSDDIAWVVENLKIDYPYTVIDFNQEDGYLDLELMKHCKHNIVANSSFSWWGAWLNENPEKIVIAPEKWTAQKNNKCDIIPRDWVKL